MVLTYSLQHGWSETEPPEAGEEEDVHDGNENDDDGGVEQTEGGDGDLEGSERDVHHFSLQNVAVTHLQQKLYW